MKTRCRAKVLNSFLCLSVFLMWVGFPGLIPAATEINTPIGQMISKGVVKFETKGNVWKNVEASLFPIFRGSKMKTEKGMATVTLSNDIQIEVGPKSLFSFDQNGRFILARGNIEYRVPPGSEMSLEAGGLFFLSCRPLQVTASSSIHSEKDEGASGLISVLSNGAVTVKSTQGKITVVRGDRVVLAALSTKETVTIPPNAAGKEKIIVAQVAEKDPAASSASPDAETTEKEATDKKEFLGLSTSALVGVGAGAAGLIGLGVWGVSSTSGGPDTVPICP
jgi:hypothetical protein